MRSPSSINSGSAICLARSGVCAAIVDYRGGSLWNDAAAVNVTGNQYYSVGEPVNFLLIDASAPVFRGNRTILDGINLTNVNEADDVQLASMTVSWSPAAAERLTEISFGGSAAWTGSAAGGQQLTVNCLFVHQQTQTMKLTFSTDTDLAGKTISAVFGVGGGSRRTMNLLNAGLTGNREFSIKATGQVREDVVWRRTIEATYDTGAGKITSWREIYSHLN